MAALRTIPCFTSKEALACFSTPPRFMSDTNERGRSWYFPSSHPLAGYTEWRLYLPHPPPPSLLSPMERSLFLALLQSVDLIPLFPSLSGSRLRGDWEGRVRSRQIDLVTLFVHVSNDSRLLKIVCTYRTCFFYTRTLLQLAVSYVSASTNLVGKFTQSVRRIVQDVKDEGTSSKSERYFITFISRGSLIKL